MITLGSLVLFVALWAAMGMVLGSSGCAGLKSAVRPTMAAIAEAMCQEAEHEQRSPGDVAIDAYCQHPEVINAIIGELLAAKRASRVRLAALHHQPATVAPLPVPPPVAGSLGDTGDP